jgi:hypothetical protein
VIIRSKKTAKAIADGRVTQIRHTARPLKTGHDYPVQPGRGKPALCRVHVLGVSTQPMSALTFRDAKREGYRTTAELKAEWVRHHDQRWVLKQQDPEDRELVERFEARHTSTLVQVVVFEVVVDEPRYLASQYDILHGHTDRGEYTARPGKAIDDLEVISDAEASRYAKAAEANAMEQRDRFRNDRQTQAQRKEWQRRPLRRKVA